MLWSVSSERGLPGPEADTLKREVERHARVEQGLHEQLDVELKKAAVSADLFRLLVSNVRDYAIFVLDPAGYITTWNIGAERIKGYRADEIIGRHFSVFYPEADVHAGKCEREIEVATRDGRFEDEDWRVRKDGSRFWANVVITAIRDDGGALIGFAKVTRDLTERKRTEEERAARAAAEQANRTKDEFLATLGHELRNPLAPIVTALQLCKLHTDRYPGRELQVIERQVQHMARLVDDLLDVARVSRGKLSLQKQTVELRDPIGKAIEIASPLMDQKSHHFELDVPPYPLLVDGDAPRLTQIFANLICNAAKYTDPGGHIAVLVRRTEGEIYVEVRDDGIGMDRELLPRVFEPFVQGDQPSDRAGGGLGLGLGLVRALAGLHGGEVSASSEGVGLGSTFTVRLPAVDRATPHPRGGSLVTAFGAAPRVHRILVVDDNDDARMLLADVLGELGHDVQAAEDGAAALEVIRGFLPDIAVLDIGLPGMDGYELAARLRSVLPDVPLIALSGYGQPTDQSRSQAAGFDRHLVKPVELRPLLETISELCQKAPRR
jgi:PAS domain S-box-containing protein